MYVKKHIYSNILYLEMTSHKEVHSFVTHALNVI